MVIYLQYLVDSCICDILACIRMDVVAVSIQSDGFLYFYVAFMSAFRNVNVGLMVHCRVLRKKLLIISHINQSGRE